MKLYRYRPVSEMLFKELLYDELYLASPAELNDPLDLNAQLNFFSSNRDEIRALVHFLLTRAFVSSHGRIDLMKKLLELMSYERLGEYIMANFLNYETGVVTKSDLFDILSSFFDESASVDREIEEFESEELFFALDALFSQFLNNSSVACFSESNNSFPMWSHWYMSRI